MIGDNRIIIAAAGSGKTTYLVEQAMQATDGRVLITTYTESNEAEIRQKFFDLVGRVPAHVTITTWFSFLITHGVKPFQGCTFDFDVAGMVFAVTQSGIKTVVNGHPIPYAETDFRRHFFDQAGRVFSDKLPKLVIRCNDNSGGAAIDRIARIFPHVFVDEVQDLAGYDLDILAALARSPTRLLMVGDPRQVTYLTHHEKKYKKYSDGGIVKFVQGELRKVVPFAIDDATLGPVAPQQCAHLHGVITSLSGTPRQHRLRMREVPDRCPGAQRPLPRQAFGLRPLHCEGEADATARQIN